MRYIISVNENGEVRFYTGAPNSIHQFSPAANDAIIYDSREDARRDAYAKISQKYNYHIHVVHTCPNCRRRYVGYPALSRKDSKTKICPDCGIIEALRAAIDSLE